MAMIVAGVDGSDESKAALRFALEEARLRKASLRVVHAEHHHGIVHGQHDGGGHDRADWLAGIVREAVGAGPEIELEQSVLEGGAASVLVEAAEGAELLVVGSRGHGGFAGLLLGSVSQQVAHHAACPVVIVRWSEGAGAMKKIVVGIDCSSASKPVLQFAVGEAELRNASLVVVHAWKHATGGLYTYYMGGVGEQLGGSEETRGPKEQKALERLVHKLVPNGQVEAWAVEGDPVRVLLDAAKDAELLVVGSRGAGGFESLLLGSVSAQCAHHAGCPVVIVRPVGPSHRLMWPEV